MVVGLHLSPHTHVFIPSFSHWTKTPNVYINIDTHFVDPTALEQLRLPMQMSRLSPTPDRGKVIWTAEYKWLGMIDRPSHWPPSTDRWKSRQIYASLFLLSRLSLCLTHSLKQVKTYIYASSSTSYKLLIVLQFNTNTQETLPELRSHAQQASTGPGNIQICAIFPIISTLLEYSPHPNSWQKCQSGQRYFED